MKNKSSVVLVPAALGIVVLALLVLEPSLASAATVRESERGDMSNWRRQSSSLQRKINALDDDRVDELPMPILFGVTPAKLTKNFGDARGTNRTHEGLDIIVPKRSLIVSPTEAVVIRVGYGESAGNYVYTANPGGETFAYMHLDEMSELDEGNALEAGDLIGFVGNTGNASATVAHLHFEVHDDDGDPTDPYPRLTGAFSLKEKAEFLDNIIDEVDDEEEVARFVALQYRTELLQARAQQFDLPEEVDKELNKLPVVTTPSSASASTALRVGSRGAAVVALQEFLIKKNIGSAAKIQADGSFGPITRAALIEYQQSAGLSADGVAGPRTLAHIAAQS